MVWMNHSLLIYIPNDELSLCVWFFATVNKGTINILAYAPMRAGSFIFMDLLGDRVCALIILIDMSRIAFSKDVNSVHFPLCVIQH